MKLQKQTLKNSSLTILVTSIIISFIMVMYTGSLLFSRYKTDITSLHKNAINPQSINITKNVTSAINITVYMSENLASEYPELGFQSQFLFRLLEKYRMLSNGKITYNIKNPEPFSLVEEEAIAAGIRSFPDSTGIEKLYFGAVFNNEKGKAYTIPYFSVQRQNYTEYDISRVLGKLEKFQKKKIGIASFGINFSDWQFTKLLQNDYKIEKINPQSVLIPSDIEILIVYNPQRVSNSFIYALDQYIMRGGKVILLIDPYSEYTANEVPASKTYKNNLTPLLENLGIKFDPNIIVAQKTENNFNEQNYVGWFNIGKQTDSNFNELTRGFLNFSFRTPGELIADYRETANYTPLFSTSQQSGIFPTDFVKYADKEMVNNSFQSDEKTRILGFYISGWFESLFEKSIVDGTLMEYKLPPFIIGSIEKSSIIVIADSDFINDGAWNLTQYQSGSTVYDQLPGANNADFLLRAIDIMSENKDVAGLYPNYLINMDKSINEQIYNRIFQHYNSSYQEKRKQIITLQDELEDYKDSLLGKGITPTMSKIQKLENYNRRILELQEELKYIEFQIKKANERKVAELIVMNTLVFPMILIFILWLGIKLYNHYQKQKVLRLINE